ncbi:carbon-nitrogen hydrolase [Chaetomidium leptoderma]|uniref:Carbon-nitrogen hydrolase n=1 Tax=Chaetomidium leptoderma TaxID=669021 RepID=A0AAN6ZX26_9PEZI|nr:carbon-nitrogen hydrolase [Chaetomidium leptoderma]
MAPKAIRLGTASPGTRATATETLAQLEHLAGRAAARNIDILLLPEAYLGGYPRGTHFGCVIGNRSHEGREEYLRYFQSAVDLGDTVGDGAGAGQAWVNRTLPSDAVPGSDGGEDTPNRRGDGTREELERISHETGVFVVTGLIEKAGGSMYCSVVYVCPKLGIIGKRRKVMPTGTERLVWAQGSPATLRAVSTTIRGARINLAAAICWENYMPLVRQALYAQNINLYLAPTADNRDTWLSLLRTTAIEGRCFVLSSNMCTRETPAPATTNGHTTSTTTHHEPENDRDPSPLTTSARGRKDTRTHHHRRSSCVTEEGFEIALPKSTSPNPRTTSSHDGDETPRRRRRQSVVLDEAGNEIVLPCSPPPPPPPPAPPAERRARRQSVFDEDGNLIVLCASRSNSVTGSGEKKKKHAAAAAAPKPSPPPTTTTTAAQNGKPGFTSRGGSAIVSPFGDVLAGPQWEDDEGIIYADVDFDDCIRGRLDLDTAGSYSRNDSFRFEVRGLDLTPLPY